MYYVKTKDISGHEIMVEVSFEIYQLFEAERKQNERDRYERRKHIDDSPKSDHAELLPSRHDENPEETLIRRETLQTVLKIVEACTPIQRERFYLNRVFGYSGNEIAKIQGCRLQAVYQSVNSVLKKIKKYFRA
jgi:DNA-directed RNA polymerase specialized sigma24 family protein